MVMRYKTYPKKRIFVHQRSYHHEQISFPESVYLQMAQRMFPASMDWLLMLTRKFKKLCVKTDQGKIKHQEVVILKIINHFHIPCVAAEMAADEAEDVHCYLLPNFLSRDVYYKYLRQRRLYK